MRGRIQLLAQCFEPHVRLPSAGRLGQPRAKVVTEAVRQRCVEAQAVGRSLDGTGTVPVPVLGDLDGVGAMVVDRSGEIAAEAVPVHGIERDADLIVANPVDPILV